MREPTNYNPLIDQELLARWMKEAKEREGQFDFNVALDKIQFPEDEAEREALRESMNLEEYINDEDKSRLLTTLEYAFTQPGAVVHLQLHERGGLPVDADSGSRCVASTCGPDGEYCSFVNQHIAIMALVEPLRDLKETGASDAQCMGWAIQAFQQAMEIVNGRNGVEKKIRARGHEGGSNDQNA